MSEVMEAFLFAFGATFGVIAALGWFLLLCGAAVYIGVKLREYRETGR